MSAIMQVLLAIMATSLILNTIECKPASIVRDAEIDLPSYERIYKRSVNPDIIKEFGFELSGTEKISKRSIFRDTNTPLLGSERITKRSSEDSDEDIPAVVVAKRSAEDIPKYSDSYVDDMDTEASGLVFRPLFRSRYYDTRRFRRSLEETDKNEDDMENAASGLVFRPLFRSRFSNTRRFRRSLEETEPTKDDMETGASGLVFRPLFRYSGRRYRRSAQEADDDMETAANTIVFRPLFRSRSHAYNRRF